MIWRQLKLNSDWLQYELWHSATIGLISYLSVSLFKSYLACEANTARFTEKLEKILQILQSKLS
jgi:hypothetical protein